jgi:predicted GIY-YIG superfamily endonuclease
MQQYFIGNKMSKYYVYILTNKKNGTLYTGVTDNLLRQIIEYKKKLIKDLLRNIISIN